MKYRLLAALPLLVGLILLAGAGAAEPAAATMVSHDVYFALKDNTADAKKKLVEACKKYLTGHPGTSNVWVGVLAEEFKGSVNDRDFDVALHIVFKDSASHDKYQQAQRHQQFIAEVKPSLKQVRVFDSLVETRPGAVDLKSKLKRAGGGDEPAAGGMLAHDVYFSLKDNTAEAKTKVVEACKKYLTGHRGTSFFAAGVLAADLKRDVNDRDFDVALHIVFDDKGAHDRYQESERHKQFIAEVKEGLKKVRVFDSLVEAGKADSGKTPE